MGYELYYDGHISFDRPVRLDPSDEDRLPFLRFFAPMFEQTDGTPTGHHVTGFQVDERVAHPTKSWFWGDDIVAIGDFARRHQVECIADLQWEGDACPPDPADDRGFFVFDIHGEHHQVRDSENSRAVETHRQRSCTCYPDSVASPAPVPEPVGPLIPRHSGQLTDYTVQCADHGQIIFIPDKGLAEELRREHIARHHR